MNFGWAPSASDRKLLPEGRLAGPMPWVIAIMMFLTALAMAAGLALGGAARALGDDLAGKLTIQVIEADPAVRDAQARAIERALGRLPAVANVERVDDAELAAMLSPWIGVEALAADEVPIPAMIDARIASADPAAIDGVERAVRAAAPRARVDRHARWLAPVARVIDGLRWLAAAVVALMAIATAACVVLAARSALNTHRATIDVLHLMGATDLQIARLFQRRIALDALSGGLLGLGVAAAVIVALGARLNALGSETLGAIGLGWPAWVAILALPVAGAVLATFAARITVLRTLRTML